MIYNPIFEEELDKKIQFKQLKKEIKKRARHASIRQTMDRVYNLLQRKPILTIAALFHPVVDLIKTSRTTKEI